MATRGKVFPPYVPSRPGLGTCWQCGVCVIETLWTESQFVEQEPRLSPVFGVPHVCQPSPREEPMHE
jgi:hypothetical protein